MDEAEESALQFEISHEFDASLAVLERALLSPELGTRLSARLSAIESVEILAHTLSNGELTRVLRFQASAPLAVFGRSSVAREAMAWEEHWHYRLADHASTWRIHSIKSEWMRYFESEGSYQLVSLSAERTRRVVKGRMRVHVAILGAAIERFAMIEVRKTYDAEADALRELSGLKQGAVHA